MCICLHTYGMCICIHTYGMCICIHTYIRHVYLHTYIHTACVFAYIHTYGMCIWARSSLHVVLEFDHLRVYGSLYVYVYVYVYVHVYVYMCYSMHACVYFISECIRYHIQAYIHIKSLVTHAHTHSLTHTHTQEHTKTQSGLTHMHIFDRSTHSAMRKRRSSPRLKTTEKGLTEA